MQLQKVAREDGVQQVALVGALDIAGTQEIDMKMHAATAAGGKPTIVDMAGVDFVSSIGIGLLLACCTSLRRKGAKMVLYNVRPEIYEVFKASQITQLLPVAEDESAAVTAAM